MPKTPKSKTSGSAKSKRKGSEKKKAAKKGTGQTMAHLADKYDLYQRSVQSPEHEVWFFNRVFKREFGRAPSLLREDFCGTAIVACEWVRRRPGKASYAVDLDPTPLRWGEQYNRGRLARSEQERVRLVVDDSCKVKGPKADIVAAQNFSFQCFKDRVSLRTYFQAAYKNLAKEGLIVLDMLGGPEVIEEGKEEVKEFPGFDYVWEQKRFDPITHDCEFAIHFRFPDGSRLNRAFRYDWRLWSIPEVRELLVEAGFSRADVYWEDTDSDTGEGTDTYRRRERGTADPAWVAYIVGVK